MRESERRKSSDERRIRSRALLKRPKLYIDGIMLFRQFGALGRKVNIAVVVIVVAVDVVVVGY